MAARAVDLATPAYKTAAGVARTLPPVLVEGLVRWGGASSALASPARRAQVERNLRRVYGPGFRGVALRRAVLATFESYARYWAEAFRLPDVSRDELAARLIEDGWEHVEAALEAGNGAIIALPHLGGWEWAGFWVAMVKQQPISVVVEALEPPELFEWFAGLRRSLGMNVIPLGPDAGAQVVRALRDNHVVCLLCDRDIGGGGIEVEFFGETTRVPAGPATLALRTGAPILPTAIYYEGRRDHRGVVLPPLPLERRGKLRDDVSRITQDLTTIIEELIRRAPEQWHLMQPNWPSDPGYKVA